MSKVIGFYIIYCNRKLFNLF